MHLASFRRKLAEQLPCAWRAVLALAVWALGSVGAQAQESNPREHQVKAVFIFNFIQFAEWPETAFGDPGSPIRIGILGEDEPLADALESAVRGEKIRQRGLEIARARRAQDLRDCHVVFVGRSERAQIPALIAATDGRPILTVGDVPDFARRGGMINFYLEDHKVRFEINRVAAQRSGLKLSSQLLGLARIVGPRIEGGDQ